MEEAHIIICRCYVCKSVALVRAAFRDHSDPDRDYSSPPTDDIVSFHSKIMKVPCEFCDGQRPVLCQLRDSPAEAEFANCKIFPDFVVAPPSKIYAIKWSWMVMISLQYASNI
ncbi:MAG: hypothetical protein NC095_12125 [Muribaculum sp.]|nr:hypothetical protein [Muribaculum sp.]